MAARSTAVATIRNILKEIQLISRESELKHKVHWRQLYAYDALSNDLEMLKKSENKTEMENSLFTAKAYLCYLQALNRGKELEKLYKGRGERSIEDSAARVGLKLPKQYKE